MEDDRLEVLLTRAQGGDQRALDELIEAYGPRVRLAIRGRLAADLKRRVDTEDIFQSTIAASLKGIVGLRYEGEKAFVRWLARAAERRLLHVARRHRAEMRDVGREAPLQAAGSLPASRTSPTRGVVRDEVDRDVRSAVSGLPDLERRVVELRSFAGETFQRIADELGLPDRHAARDVYRSALRKMADLLEAQELP